MAAAARPDRVPNVANSFPARIGQAEPAGAGAGRAPIVAPQPSSRLSRQLDWRGSAAEDRTDRFVPTRLGRAKTSFDPMIWLARPERQAPPSPASWGRAACPAARGRYSTPPGLPARPCDRGIECL